MKCVVYGVTAGKEKVQVGFKERADHQVCCFLHATLRNLVQ